MITVFVETNFLVDVLRPLPSPEASALLDRHVRGEVQLWLPWCCAAEASRTLTRVIDEDLGFADRMVRFAASEYRKRPGSFDKSVIDSLRTSARDAREQALASQNARILALVDRLNLIAPGADVVSRTLSLFSVKQLNPFDEMIAGAVLCKAAELFDQGVRDLYFCELDKDLWDTHAPLAQAYAECGLKLLRSFHVP